MAKRVHNSDELFELKWSNYSQSITDEIYNIRQNDCLVDLTFCCEGVTIGCHKLLIYACSPVLRQILTANPSPHPIIYITDIKLPILQAVLKYIYQGEVQISKSDLVAFMKAADSFQIRGLQNRSGSVSSNLDAAKKRRTFEGSAGPSTATLTSLGRDPLTSTMMKEEQAHDTSNLDFSEFENECTFGANDESSMDETHFSSASAAALTPTVQQTAQKLRRFIKSSATGIEVMNEYEQHGALTDEKREDLSQLVSEFMAKGVVKGGRAGHEAIAEATLILFPGTFEDDPKTLAEALYNRLSRQTQQRYGTESPEVPRIKHEKSDFPIQNKYLLAASALQVRDLDALMTRMQLELRGLCEKWIDDVIEGLGSDALSKVTDFQPRIVVDVDDAGKLYSSVECFLCRKDIRVGFKKCRSALGLKCNFIRGNFDRHFNVHHNIKN